MFARTAFTATACLVAMALGLGPLAVRAEDEAPKTKAELSDADALAVQQQQIADKFKHLEEVLLRMAELTGPTDPRRAALLKKAVAQSKEQLIGVQFESLIELLRKDELSRASDGQTQVNQDLKTLLELLLSENRAKRIESEKARIREYLKQLNQIIKQQKGIQGRTAGRGDPKQLSEDQRKLAHKTGDLAEDIKRNEEDGKTGQLDDQKKGEKGDAQGKGKQGKEAQGKPDGDADKGEKNDKDQGQKDTPSPSPKPPDQGKGQPPSQEQGQPQGQGQNQGQAQDQPSPPNPNENPARKRLETARQRMQEAQKNLDEAKREGAVEKQEKAIRELEEAKAELERILRQLREEEMERVLAMLEARFTKMLQMQREVYEGTVRLDKVPEAERTHNHEIESGRLSAKEAEIVLETDRALALLREDGTAVAFPEAIEQMRADMEQVVQRLAQFKVNDITQAIEQDIIAALEEMLAALKKAIQENQQRQQAGDQMASEGQDPPLVDLLSEIRMIRTLQMRVNLRTERYSKMIHGEQADNAELVQALAKLAERQQRIFEITRDLQKGKNR